MRLATIKTDGSEIAGIVTPEGILPIKTLNEARANAFSGTKNAGPGGTKDAGPVGTKNAGPGGAKDAGPVGTKDAGPGGTKDAGPGGTKDAGPGGTKNAGTGGTKDAGLGGTKDAGPGSAENDTLKMAGFAAFGGNVPLMWEEQMLPLIQTGQLLQLTEWYNNGGKDAISGMAGLIPFDQVVYGPLYRDPKRIFGIGLNYKDHAADIGDPPPTGFPGSFFKMPDTLIGPADEIRLPTLKEATRTTAEAELGVILSKECRDVPEENWLDAVAGFTTILDMTEESILKGNEFLNGDPRYLSIVKNFPTFFSFGPQLVTPDEIPDLSKLEIQSVHNGEVYAKNIVANMTHSPARLVSLHSSIQGWYPGDVLSTGTPRAFPIAGGDTAECRIVGPDGFVMEPLINPVVDPRR